MRGRARTLQSKKYLKKKRKHFIFMTVISIVCIVSLASAAVFFLRLDRLLIHEVQIVGNQAIKTEEIQKIVEEYLDGTSSLFIPRRSIFTYPSSQIASAIEAAFPRVDEVRPIRHGDILSVTVNERLPSAVVCDDVTNDPCYFSDEGALIYAQAPSESIRLYTNFIVTDKLVIDTEFMKKDQFAKLKTLADDFTKLGIPVAKVTVQDDGDIKFVSKTDVDVLVRQAASYEQTRNNLALFLEKLKQQDRNRKEQTQLVQIDLRYGNSVFYRSASDSKVQ